MKPYAKFAILVVAIIGTLGWLAAGGINETKTYYKEIKEVTCDGPGGAGKAHPGRRRRREGLHRPRRQRSSLRSYQNDLKLPVVYVGTDPLPDTFRDGSQALADGKMRSDGVFQASRIQAKCASKYEGKPSYKVKQPLQTKAAL